jgi:hypothetical protein
MSPLGTLKDMPKSLPHSTLSHPGSFSVGLQFPLALCRQQIFKFIVDCKLSIQSIPEESYIWLLNMEHNMQECNKNLWSFII